MSAAVSVQVAGEAARSPLRARSVSRSHLGSVRAINEDRLFECPEAGLWAVADGMGGHAGGDLAAQAVIDGLRLLAGASVPHRPCDLLPALRRANEDIRRRNSRLGTTAGATVAALMVEDDRAHVVWAGDSRVYRLRNGAADLVTRDHSVVQELVDAGLLTAEAAETHPQTHVITRALGIAAEPGLQSLNFALEPGERVLVCTDGLHRSMTSADIDAAAIEILADRLLANALRRDGSDNATLVIVEWLPAEQAGQAV